jgi:tetratricopeptide (TPR) repeat protein
LASIEAQTLLSKGVSLSTLGRYDEAITLFDVAVKSDANYIEAYDRKGIALVGAGKCVEAIDCFDKYIEIDPRDIDVLNQKGALLNLLGRREEAIACFNQALSCHPWHYETLYNKGVALFLSGKYAEAVTCIEKVQEVSSSQPVSTLLRICSEKIGRRGLNDTNSESPKKKPQDGDPNNSDVFRSPDEGSDALT